MTTVADLIASKTAAQYFDELATRLAAEGFPVTAWQVGNAGRTLTRVDAAALADLRAIVAAVCKGGYLDESIGAWLTLLAKGVFDLDRVPAAFMAGTVSVSCAGGAGPYTISPAGLVVSDGTRRWRSTNTSNVTVASGDSAQVRVRAEAAGTDYNVSGGAVTAIITPASAGLSVSAASGSAWRTSEGAAEESDATLRARCRGRWSTLGRGANVDAYVYWCTNVAAAPTVTRAKTVPGSGDGTITVYVAQATSAATSPQVSAVQTAIDLQKPITDSVTVAAAGAQPIAVTGSVVFRSATFNTTAATDAIEAALRTYITSKGFGDTVDLGGLYAAIYGATPGVVDVDLSAPSADTVLGVDKVATDGAFTITYTP